MEKKKERKSPAHKSLAGESRRVVITVSIERHTVECLRELALKDNMSLSRLVENYLRNVLNEYRREKGELKADEKIKSKIVGGGGKIPTQRFKRKDVKVKTIRSGEGKSHRKA